MFCHLLSLCFADRRGEHYPRRQPRARVQCGTAHAQRRLPRPPRRPRHRPRLPGSRRQLHRSGRSLDARLKYRDGWIFLFINLLIFVTLFRKSRLLPR